MFEAFPQNNAENLQPQETKKYIVSMEYDIKDEHGNIDPQRIDEEVESEEVKKGADELLRRFGGFLSLREAIDYALATPDQISEIEKMVKEREEKYYAKRKPDESNELEV